MLLKGSKKPNWPKDFSQAVLLQYFKELLGHRVTEFLKNKPIPKGEFSFKNYIELSEEDKKKNKMGVGYFV